MISKSKISNIIWWIFFVLPYIPLGVVIGYISTHNKEVQQMQDSNKDTIRILNDLNDMTIELEKVSNQYENIQNEFTKSVSQSEKLIKEVEQNKKLLKDQKLLYDEALKKIVDETIKHTKPILEEYEKLKAENEELKKEIRLLKEISKNKEKVRNIKQNASLLP